MYLDVLVLYMYGINFADHDDTSSLCDGQRGVRSKPGADMAS